MENKWDEVEININKPVYVTDLFRPSDKVYMIKQILFERMGINNPALHVTVIAECITEGPDKGSTIMQSSEHFNYVYNGD